MARYSQRSRSRRRGFSRGSTRSPRRVSRRRSSYGASRRAPRDIRLVIQQAAPQPALTAQDVMSAGRMRMERPSSRSMF